MTWREMMTWQETIEVARFLQIPCSDLDLISSEIVEQALVIIRARGNE